MRSMRVALALASVCLGFVSCSRDVTLPELPQRGKVLGVVDTQGHVPAGGNTVTLVAEDGSKAVATTAADGSFIFSDVQPGVYYLDIQMPGFAPLVRPSLRVLSGRDLDAGTLAPAWLAGTPSEGVVTGKVVVTGGGDAMGGQVEFILQPVGQRVALAAIGLQGLFVQRVPPGTYQLRASHPLYVTATLDDVSVAEAENKDLSQSPLSMALNPATITGSVTKEVDGQAPAPAAGALVTLGTGATTTTDGSGNFTLTGLAAGNTTVRYSLAGFHDTGDAHPLGLQPGQTTTLPPLTLALDRGSIAGTVSLADRQTATDVTVSVAGTAYNAVATPDPTTPYQGAFQVLNVPVGTYEVDATKARYSRAVAGSVAVTAGATTHIGTLTLTVLQGDFVITGGDPTTPGFTRQRAVTLDLSSFTGAAQYRASEDSAFTGVPFQGFTGSNQPFTLSATEGTHIVYAQYMDGSGTQSPTFSASIILDTVAPTAPSIQINGGAAFTSTANPLFLTLQAQEALPPGVDTVSGLAQVRLNETGATSGGLLVATPQPYQRDLGFTRSSGTDGVQPVYAQFIDHAGNASAVVNAGIVVDTVRPTGSISIARGPHATANGYTDTPLVTLSESAGAEPNGGYVLIRLANSSAALGTAVAQPLSATSSWFLDPTSTGVKTVFAQLVDAAGNLSSTTLQATITYDTQAPFPVNAALTSPALTNAAFATVSLTATDDFALSPTQAITVSEDAFFQGPGTVGPQPFSSSVTLPLSAGDGAKTVYVRYRDAAGNDSTASVRLAVDTQPPIGQLAVTGTLADGTTSSSITSAPGVSATINHQGATGYLLGNDTLTACPSTPASYTSFAPGSGGVTAPFTLSGTASPREVRLCLIDGAGNVTGPIVRQIALDAVAPSGCTLTAAGTKVDGSAAPAGKTASPSIAVTASCASEAPVDIFLTTGSITCGPTAPLDWQPYSSPRPFLLSGLDGTYQVTGCVRDAARNVSALPQASMQLKRSPPTAPLLTLDNGAQYVNAAQVGARGGYKVTAAGSASGATEWALSETTTFAAFQDVVLANPVQYTFASPVDGTKPLFAIFRDEVGNLSAVAPASITFDTVAPAGGTLGIAPPLGAQPGFTNSVSATVTLTAPADAQKVMLVPAASAAACAPSDFSGAFPVPLFVSTTFVLPSGDGPKRACAELIDDAGNVGGILSATITLDTVAPSAPFILTADQVVAVPDNGTQSVLIAGPVSDANFLRFERLGGKLSAWTADATPNSGSPISFTYNLSNTGAQVGTPNLLRLRAVDRAGNASPEASVLVATDTVAPGPPVLNVAWVANKTGQATLWWSPSTTPADVGAYKVYYGSASGVYTGTNAIQGPSPITVPAPGSGPVSMTLSGLIDGASTFVRVRTLDRAGNESGNPSPTNEVVLQPNQVPMDVVANTALGMGFVTRLARYGTTLYAFGTAGTSFPTTAVLQPIDISTIVSPTQGGVPQASPAGPVAGTAITFPGEPLDSISTFGGGVDMAIDGQYLFLASSTKLRIYSLAVPSAPSIVATLDFAAPFANPITAAQGIAVKGATLFITGRVAAGTSSNVIALDLTKLYDNNSGTTPSTADVIGTASSTFNRLPGGLTWTRNNLIQVAENAFSASFYDVTNALARTGPPALIGSTNMPLMSTPPRESGNFLYTQDVFSGFQVLKLDSLWAGAPVNPNTDVLASYQATGNGQIDVVGTQAFIVDQGPQGLHALDLTDVGAGIGDQGVLKVTGAGIGTSVLVYGNYTFSGTNLGRLLTFESAVPGALHRVAAGSRSGPRGELVGGFIYSGVLAADLQSGSPPGGKGVPACYFDQARFDDSLVLAEGTLLRVVDLSNGLDRNGPGVLDFSQSYTFAPTPAGTRVTGVAAVGTYLVAAETRSDGHYVEVFDARPVRDRIAATSLSMANSRGFYKFTSSVPAANAWDEITVHNGRAFVAVDQGPGAGTWAVDIRPLLGDGTAGNMVPITSTPNSVQGFVAPSGTNQPRQIVVRGNYAYVANGGPTVAVGGLEIFDVSQALDEDINTSIPASPPRASVALGAATALSVQGSYALVTPIGGTTLLAVDVSSPLAPAVAGSMPYGKTFITCNVGAPVVSINVRPSIMMAGNKAYVTYYQDLEVIDLE